MKLTYFLESDASKCCPPNVLKKGYRVRWKDGDTSMYGRVVSTGGNTVKVTDEKFGTDEKHTVARDQIYQVLADPEADSKQMKVIWSKGKSTSSPTEEPPLEEPEEDVKEAKHTLIGNKLDFKQDEEVEEIVLTKADSHDLATLLAKVAIMQAYVDLEHEAEKSKGYEDEIPVEVSVKAVAERASEMADNLSNHVRDAVSEIGDGTFRDLVKHYFPDLR